MAPYRLTQEQRYQLLRLACTGLVSGLVLCVIGIVVSQFIGERVPGTLATLAGVCAAALGQLLVPPVNTHHYQQDSGVQGPASIAGGPPVPFPGPHQAHLPAGPP